jgi:hypothetical protein
MGGIVIETIYDDSVRLFLEATRAFEDVKLDLTPVVLCRASLEAALYTFFTRSSEDGENWRITLPLRLDEGVRRVPFEELIEAVSKKGPLDANQLKDLGVVKEHGDHVAHLAARNDRELILRRLSQGRKPRQHPAEEGSVEKDLKATLGILKTLIQAHFIEATKLIRK